MKAEISVSLINHVGLWTFVQNIFLPKMEEKTIEKSLCFRLWEKNNEVCTLWEWQYFIIFFWGTYRNIPFMCGRTKKKSSVVSVTLSRVTIFRSPKTSFTSFCTRWFTASAPETWGCQLQQCMKLSRGHLGHQRNIAVFQDWRPTCRLLGPPEDL